MTDHTPTPWHSDDTAIFAENGVLARIPNHPENGKNWMADAAFICKAVNNHDALVKALLLARARIEYLGAACNDPRHFEANAATFLPALDEVLSCVSTPGKST